MKKIITGFAIAMMIAISGAVYGASPMPVQAKEESKRQITLNSTDVNGQKVTSEFFKDNKLTLVNILSTSCKPCMEELPHLGELAKEYKGKKVGVMMISADVDDNGTIDETAREILKTVVEKHKMENPVTFADKNLIGQIMNDLQGFPLSYFVDKDGKIVSEVYLGSHSKKEWKEIIEKELKSYEK